MAPILLVFTPLHTPFPRRVELPKEEATRKDAFLRRCKRPELQTWQALLYIQVYKAVLYIPMGLALALNKYSTTRVLELPVTEIPVM